MSAYLRMGVPSSAWVTWFPYRNAIQRFGGELIMRKNRLRKAVLAASVPIGASLFAASMAALKPPRIQTPMTRLVPSKPYRAAITIPRPRIGGLNMVHQRRQVITRLGGPIPRTTREIAAAQWSFTGIWSASSDGSGSTAFTADTFPFASHPPPNQAIRLHRSSST